MRIANTTARASVRPTRASEIVRIHVLRTILGMGEDAYRDLIAQLFSGRRSSTELDDTERGRFLQHLQRLADELPGAQRSSRRQRVPLTPRQRKMFALWQQLADRGLVRDRRMAALDAWVRRRSWLGQRVDHKGWLDGRREDQVIESLKRWLRRGEEDVAEGTDHVPA